MKAERPPSGTSSSQGIRLTGFGKVGSAAAVCGFVCSTAAAAMMGAVILGSDPYQHVGWLEPVFNAAAVVWLAGAGSSLVGVIGAARARTTMRKLYRVAAAAGLVVAAGTLPVLAGIALGLAWGSW